MQKKQKEETKKATYRITDDFYSMVSDEIQDFNDECELLSDKEDEGNEIEMLKRLQAMRYRLESININHIACNLDRLTAKILTR
ncbi:MAG: hypothetical protein ACYCT7_08740 [bacterium]